MVSRPLRPIARMAPVSTEDPMAMQRLTNARVVSIGTVDDTTVSSLRTYSQSA